LVGFESGVVYHFKHFVESSDFCVVDLQGDFLEGRVVQKIFREGFDLLGPLDARVALRGLAKKILEIFHYCKFLLIMIICLFFLER
jgi:hypothetical protein